MRLSEHMGAVTILQQTALQFFTQAEMRDGSRAVLRIGQRGARVLWCCSDAAVADAGRNLL